MNIIGRLSLFERMHDLMNVACSLNVIINVHSSNMRYMIHIRYVVVGKVTQNPTTTNLQNRRPNWWLCSVLFYNKNIIYKHTYIIIFICTYLSICLVNETSEMNLHTYRPTCGLEYRIIRHTHRAWIGWFVVFLDLFNANPNEDLCRILSSNLNGR